MDPRERPDGLRLASALQAAEAQDAPNLPVVSPRPGRLQSVEDRDERPARERRDAEEASGGASGGAVADGPRGRGKAGRGVAANAYHDFERAIDCGPLPRRSGLEPSQQRRRQPRRRRGTRESEDLGDQPVHCVGLLLPPCVQHRLQLVRRDAGPQGAQGSGRGVEVRRRHESRIRCWWLTRRARSVRWLRGTWVANATSAPALHDISSAPRRPDSGSAILTR